MHGACVRDMVNYSTSVFLHTIIRHITNLKHNSTVLVIYTMCLRVY